MNRVGGIGLYAISQSCLFSAGSYIGARNVRSTPLPCGRTIRSARWGVALTLVALPGLSRFFRHRWNTGTRPPRRRHAGRWRARPDLGPGYRHARAARRSRTPGTGTDLRARPPFRNGALGTVSPYPGHRPAQRGRDGQCRRSLLPTSRPVGATQPGTPRPTNGMN